MVNDSLPGRPYAKVYTFNGRQFTVVVIDSDEFDRLLNDLEARPLSGTDGVWLQCIDSMRRLSNIPAIGRGTKTQWVFERYGVETDMMGVIVRGRGAEVAHKLGLL